MYDAFICEIKEIKKHPNADRLFLTTVFGNQVIIGDDLTVGQKVIYFPTDGRLSIEFCEANKLIGTTDANGNRIGGYFNSNRKVQTIRLRKEVSDGFIIPVESLSYTNVKMSDLKLGMMFNEINGHKICEKYITQKTYTQSQKGKKNKKGIKETIHYEIFHEHIDTKNLDYFYSTLKKGDMLEFTLKCHGTSGRTSYTLEKKYSKFTNFVNNLFKKEFLKAKTKWVYKYGTRRVIVKDENRSSGFYGEDENFRKKAHNNFVDKLQKGETIYYEIVGYTDSGASIMPEVDNEKVGKDFIKQYGKTTVFNYGCLPGQSDLYAYRMSLTNEDGFEIDYDNETIRRRCEEMSVKVVPSLHEKIIYDGDEDRLRELVNSINDGKDLIGNHIREGVVVRVNTTQWRALKSKNTNFKILEGIVKNDETTIDIEEAEDLKTE